MNEKISQLMDGELDERAAAQLIEALGRDDKALTAWRQYHLISDAMRDTRLLSEDFAGRVSARLAAEPAIMAPRALRPAPRNWVVLPAAASAAAVALVGWLAFAPQQPAGPAQPQMAAAPQPAPQASKPVLVPLPTSANDYLLAHQGFSPRMSLGGMAPYVRTVSETPQEPRR